MKVAIIGRSELLFETAEKLAAAGHEIALIVTARAAPEYTRTEKDFEDLAVACGATFLYTPKILESFDKIKACGSIDVAVSINYSSIIPQPVIDCFPLGILNAHGGDLPRYRGNACQAWAILNGEEKIGLCIHRMIGDELDSGDIIARDYLAIDINTKITEVWSWMQRRIPDLYGEALGYLESDPDYVLEKQSLNPQKALRCYPRRPEDGRIDWSKTAAEILRLINASNKPYAGAFCDYNGQKMIIWDAMLAPAENYCAVPGQVTEIGPNYLDVATGAGKIRLKNIEVDGQEVAPSNLIRSIRNRLD